MNDRVVVVDVLVCLSFVLRGRYDYGCGRCYFEARGYVGEVSWMKCHG